MTPNQILKQARTEHGLSLEKMAELLGVTRQRIFQWEKGDAIQAEHLEDWAKDTRLPNWMQMAASRMLVAGLRQDVRVMLRRVDETDRILTSAV